MQIWLLNFLTFYGLNPNYRDFNMKNIPVRKINSPQKEVDFFESFNVRKIELVMQGKDMVQDLHRHDFFFFLVLEKGAGKHSIDFTQYTIGNNSVFVMHPGQVHELFLKKGSTGFVIEFSNDFYSNREKSSGNLLRRVSSRNYYQLSKEKFKKPLDIMSAIHEEFVSRQEGYRDMIKASLEMFYIELIRQGVSEQGRMKDKKQYARERLDDLLELIEKNITNKKQVSQYSEMLNLTSYQLNSITKELLGKTCSDLINEHIILEAKRYLLATSNQVNQIAFHLGFDDPSYFIRFFRKHTGFSPATFRTELFSKRG